MYGAQSQIRSFGTSFEASKGLATSFETRHQARNLSARHTTDRRVRIQAKGTFNQQKIARKKITSPSLPLNTPWGLISIVSVHFAPFATK